jgi:hypothetical protein
LTRHRVVSTPECPACYITAERYIRDALIPMSAAVDAVIIVEDFQGASDYLPGTKAALLNALAIIDRLLTPGDEHPQQHP